MSDLHQPGHPRTPRRLGTPSWRTTGNDVGCATMGVRKQRESWRGQIASSGFTEPVRVGLSHEDHEGYCAP
jgi:hypothetical protein